MGNKSDVSFVQITNCCCGVRHRMKQTAWDKYRRAVNGKPDTVPVGNGLAAWRVPRTFIACHGLIASEIRDLAKDYGWEEVKA